MGGVGFRRESMQISHSHCKLCSRPVYPGPDRPDLPDPQPRKSISMTSEQFISAAPERSRDLTLFKTREKYQLSLILSTSFLCPQKSHHIDLQIDENFIGSSVTVDTQGFCYPDNWKVRATRPVYDWSSSPSSFLT